MSNNRGMNLLRVVARPLLAAPFIADGVDALMHPRFHVERAAGVRPLIDKATDAVGLEPLTDQQLAVATRVTGAVTVVAGLRFALGRKPRVAALTLAACSGGSRKSGPGAVEYWMWDASQLPAYEACAKAFEAKTGIKVNITQIAWGDYWTKLTAGFIAGTGPDAFTDHISKFAQFVDLEVLVPLEK